MIKKKKLKIPRSYFFAACNQKHRNFLGLIKEDRQRFFIENELKAVSNSLYQCKHVWIA